MLGTLKPREKLAPKVFTRVLATPKRPLFTWYKRLFDLLFSSVALLLLAPLGVGIALLIRLTSPGPIFHPCRRVGYKGKAIVCWKFRTMCEDAEQKLALLLARSSAYREEWRRYHKLRVDPRITPLGHWLRRTSLDEIPQFLNVFLGSLSLVGPRPVTQEEIETHYGKKAEKILSVKPGLTGLWQTSGRNLLAFPERLLCEEQYVDHASLLLDLKILGKTIYVMFFAKTGW